jgi:hypothetical protein
MNLGLRQTDPLRLCLDRVDVDLRHLACSARNGSEILWHCATNTVHLTVMCLIRRSECSLFLVALLCLVEDLLRGVCSLIELQNWHPKGGRNSPCPRCKLAEIYIL